MTYQQICDFLDKCESLHPDIAGIETVVENRTAFWPVRKRLPTYNDTKEYCRGYIEGTAEIKIEEPQISLRVITKYADTELTYRGHGNKQ